MKILVDVSYWNQELTPSNWDVINRGVDGLIIRLGYGSSRDAWAINYINQCKKFGKPYAGYWYVYTSANLQNQADAIKSAVNELKPCALWLDVEDVEPTPLSIAQRTAYYKNLRDKVGSMVTIPKGCYSGDWYLNMFNGALNWVKQDTYWEARYLAWYEASWWSAFKAKFGVFDIDKLHEIAEYVGIPNGVMRQIESKIPVAGLPLNLDWNIMSDENFAKLFTNGSSVPYTPPEYVPYVVQAMLGVNVRATPSLTGKKIGALPYKTVVDIRTANITAGWGQITSAIYTGGWVYLANMRAL